ncbi:MAG: hypothetical protein WA632_02675 [Gallionella sp.]
MTTNALPDSQTKHAIDARVEFSFKGEDYTLTSCVNFDRLHYQEKTFPSIYALLAKEHDIDTYSYLFEVMQESEVEFSNPQGIATRYFKDGIFDFAGFSNDWNQQKVIEQLQPIALRELDIADLNGHPALRNALVQAYKLGRQS